MRGLIREGVFVRCGEPPAHVPQCIGRCVNLARGCTCLRWPEEALEEMKAIGAQHVESAEQLVSALTAAGWKYRVACEQVREWGMDD